MSHSKIHTVIERLWPKGLISENSEEAIKEYEIIMQKKGISRYMY